MASGAPQPFEELSTYEARNVQDRFTTDMLERYCRAIGIDVFNPGAYGPETVLVETQSRPAPGGLVLTLDEAQSWLGIDRAAISENAIGQTSPFSELT